MRAFNNPAHVFLPSRNGAGAGNWGTAEDELKGQTEQQPQQAENEEAKNNEEKEEVKEAAPAPAPEPEDKTMTLEEYRKQKKSIHRNPNAKKEEEQVYTKLKD